MDTGVKLSQNIFINIRLLGKACVGFMCILFMMASAHAAKNSIDGIRVWPAPENTRVVLDLKSKPDYKSFTLKNPDRLVIDFKNTKNNVALSSLAKNDPRVKVFRSSSKNKSTMRLVLDLTKAYQLNIFPLNPAGSYGNRLVIDLYDKKQTTKTTSRPNKNNSDIVIGIDAGHGGEDPGSIGSNGTYEKRVTLAIAKKLQKLINKQKGMKAVMTRTGDYYIKVNDRPVLARNKHVDFFVSIHADAFRTSGPKGASVWLITKRRSESELARYLRKREVESELLGGAGDIIKTTTDNHFAFALADLQKDNAIKESFSVATNVIKELKKITVMHKKTPQGGNFAVLKSSDIPSILVETGFISNKQEEKNLMWGKYQQKLASAIYVGIKNHFMAHPVTGSYFASIGYKKHKVRSGESLSALAHRYKVSMSKLKKINQLKSNSLKIGQTLKIPRAG